MSAAHYTVMPAAGRWLVVHPLPGTTGALAACADCLTRGAAEREAAELNAERERRLHPITESATA